MRIHMNLDHIASGHFVLGEALFASSIIAKWPLAVCLQQRYACSVKLLYLLDGRHVNAVILSIQQSVICETEKSNYETYWSSRIR